MSIKPKQKYIQPVDQQKLDYFQFLRKNQKEKNQQPKCKTNNLITCQSIEAVHKNKQKKKTKKKANSLKNQKEILKNTLENSKKSIRQTAYMSKNVITKSGKSSQHSEWECGKINLIESQLMKQSSSKKENCSRLNKYSIKLPKDNQYLLFQDQFHHVNPLCFSKRVLNTFRSACAQQGTSKQEGVRFIKQNWEETKNTKKIQQTHKRINLFQAVQIQILQKQKLSKVSIIQKWWRKLQNKPSKIFNQFEQFQIGQIEQIQQNFDQSQQESSIQNNSKSDQIPKRINFKIIDLQKEQQSLIKYKLPQVEANEDENDQFFNSPLQRSSKNGNAKRKADENLTLVESRNNLNQAQFPIIEESSIIDESESILQQEKTSAIKQIIEERIGLQMGQLFQQQNSNAYGIQTNIFAIHHFLTNFFRFYVQASKDQFINSLNLPYGHSILRRLLILQGYGQSESMEPYEDEEGITYGLKSIISIDLFHEYFDLLYKKHHDESTIIEKTNFQLQKIHAKAIFDCFNEELNSFRPYQNLNGVPYPWNLTEKSLSFYFITEENICEIFQKTNFNVLKTSSTLIGLILPQNIQLRSHQKQLCIKQHEVITQNNQIRLTKYQQKQIKLSTKQWQFDAQILTLLLYQISSCIVEEVTEQCVLEIHRISQV